MATTEKTISGLVARQLPEFVRSNHPKFVRFLELYYEWLEDSTKGNTVYHIMNSENYYDVDNTNDEFIRLFKEQFLPYFPEKTELDLTKILKNAREFYIKKGSEESLAWLFKVLFKEDINVYYPKQQILIASDGKWKLPKAFQLTLSAENQNIDINLLEKHVGVGSISKATCTIESANRTIDKTFGTQIVEIYVSNVVREFENGEQLEIRYVDANNQVQTFSEKIIGAISNILIDSSIKTDPLQRRRGLLYNVGDPVVVFGGLDSTIEAQDAIAYVGNVSSGSIEDVTPIFPGYGYRVYSNTTTLVLRTEQDDPNSNTATDIRVAGITTANFANSNSQATFQKFIEVDKMPIEYLKEVQLDATFDVFTQNNKNIQITGAGASSGDINQFDFVYDDASPSYATANFTARVANSGYSGSGTLVLYNVQNAESFVIETDLTGLITEPAGNTLTVSSVDNVEVDANITSSIFQCLNHEIIETGGIGAYTVIEGGYGFRTTPQLQVTSYFDTYLSETSGTEYRLPLEVFGKIAHIYITNPGSGYSNGDSITVTGRGYGFAGYVNVNAAGSIIRTTITNTGEGYFGGIENRTVTVSGAGSNAEFIAYGFGEGVENAVETGAIGRIRDIRVVSRGYDYIDQPVVSLKVVDIIINAISESNEFVEGEIVFQGPNIDNPVFLGYVKSYDRATNRLRLFNYSGSSFGNFNTALTFNTVDGRFTFTVDTSKKVTPPDQYPPEAFITGLDNPYFYGNGRARAVAQFYNGLIQYPGFYLNTDGFLSADKKLQDIYKYHNYSYIIESKKSIQSYREVIKDIVHPIGMSMLAKTVTEGDGISNLTPNSSLYLTKTALAGTINVNTSACNIITGIGTDFVSDIDANDIILLIDSSYPLRSQAKIVTGDLIIADEVEIEGDFSYVGQGRLAINTAFTQLTGEVSTNPALYDGTTANVNVNPSINGTMNVTTTSNVVTGNSTSPSETTFTVDLQVGDIITINNQVKTVTVIIDDTSIQVNSAFSYAGSDNTAFIRSNVVTGISTDFTADLIVGDFITVNNEIRTVESIIDGTTLYANDIFTFQALEVPLYLGNTYVDGACTSFTTELAAGDIIKVNNEIKEVIAIISDTSFNVNTPFKYTTTSDDLYKLSNTAAKVYSNTNAVYDFIRSGDAISFNIATANLLLAQTGTVDIVTSETQITSADSLFLTELNVGDIIMINNQIRKVEDISDDTTANVNLAFSTTVTGQTLYKLATTVTGTVTSPPTSNTLQLDIAINANLNNILYRVDPDYSDLAGYAYKVIKDG